ncbi:MAG: beta-lactamase family protein, partial [Gammaproteobacteria bacterium]|nr:beta-lactamase family protein [Gammaproteobacteria bacterium]
MHGLMTRVSPGVAASITVAASLLPAHAELPTDAELAARVDAAAIKILSQPRAAGLSIAVGRSGKVILAKGYGMADVEWSVPATADTVFRIGSVTKQFTAAAIVRLVEAGKVSLDATVQTYLPDFPVKQWPVTIRHLLTHTSGMWSYTDDSTFMTRDASLELTPDELIATFKDKPLEFEPGTRYNYSNSAYYLLGTVIEKVSGKPYAAFVQEEFFSPLGLTRTRYESNGAIIPGRAQGYSFRDGTLVNDRPLGADVPGAAGSLLSTATDLVNWTTALTTGKVVTPDSFIEMTTSATLKDGNPTGYGLGLEVDMWEGRRRIAHGGGIFGFTSRLITLPDDEVTVAVLINSESMNPGTVA